MMLDKTDDPLNCPFSRPRILIVDDQAVNVRVLHELFKDECEVLMTTDGTAAVELCRAQRPDLLLLDIVMPGLSGHDICRQLKADPGTADIPIIFVTAHNSEYEEVVGLQLGASDFIHKPINPVIVKARVRTQLLLKCQSDRLREIALTDGLTGIANRRKFDDDLRRAWSHCRRDHKPVSLIMADVDYFKRYNDRYGHQAGDECLRTVAWTLRDALQRPYDTAARYGGEEFACLLPGTSAVGAEEIAARILQRVRERELRHEDGVPEPFVSVSLGVATLTPNDGNRLEDLIAAADRQLYEAKASGRARFSVVNLDAESPGSGG